MKKKKYRELYGNNQEEIKEKKPTTIVENETKIENVEKERKGFNIFFEQKNLKKSSDD